MSLLKWADCMSAQKDASYGRTIPYLQRTIMLIFLDFVLCGPNEFLPLSQSRQSVSAYVSKALRLLGLSFASQDSHSTTSFCLFMTKLAYPFGTTAVLHLASSHMVVKICHRMPRPIFVQTSSQKDPENAKLLVTDLAVKSKVSHE